MTLRNMVVTLFLVGAAFAAFLIFGAKKNSSESAEASFASADHSVEALDKRNPAESKGEGGEKPSSAQKSASAAPKQKERISPWTPSKELLASLPSAEEIEKKRRARRAAIERHKSRMFVKDEGVNTYWLDGVVGVYPEHLTHQDQVLFEQNGIAYIRAEDAPKTTHFEYQAVYDPANDRSGVLTGIVVIASDQSFNPVEAAQSVGLRHSSSRYETGLHFFDPPKRDAAGTASILDELKQKPGVKKALLATVFERARPQ